MFRKLVPAIAAAVLLWGACASPADVARVDTAAAATVRGAADAELTTGRFEITLALGAGGPGAVAVSGSFDRDAGQAAVDVDLGGVLGGLAASVPGSDQPLQAVVDGTAVYLRVPGLEPLTGTSGWVSADVAALAGLDTTGLLGPGGGDPTAVLEMLRGVSDDLETVGTEEVRGVATTRYHATLDLGAALDGAAPGILGEMEAAFSDQLDAVRSVPIDVWVGEDGIPRRLVLSLAVDDPAGEEMTSTMTVELFDLGEPVVIEVPPADEVSSLDSLVGGMADLLGSAAR
jgi:hypothetical protein